MQNCTFCWISWLHVNRFSWDFYNRDSFDETIKNLLYLEDLLGHPLLPTFNLHTHTYILCQMQSWPLVRCTPTPWADTSCGQVWYYFGSGWHLGRLWVRCTPQDQALGQVDIWADFRSGWHLGRLWVRCTPRIRLWVRLTFGWTRSGWPLIRCTPRIRLWVRLTFGWTRSGWPLIRCTPRIRFQVRLTFGQTLGRVDLWSDVPPGSGLGSGWHLGRLQVRLTFGQTNPQDQALGQVDLWLDVPHTPQD